VEQRKLPALERFEELRVSGSCGEAALKLNGELGAEGIEARRLPRGTCAARGGTGRTPYGLQSRRSKSTGPAATAPGSRDEGR
jgi:hypothetical protein